MLVLMFEWVVEVFVLDVVSVVMLVFEVEGGLVVVFIFV